ncbi:hydroxymethylglutaryl-CoA lyase [Acidaminococcus timonensis]|uniref:hydroxymethylglutaryl-CoA lyase n=1 Tax=Acidaminococcus timonensis TaxID=1871002 RepID=UPI002591599A|nr:hydroxymethylglutaryl-CoA lyase [uncultured Acidaminococcus sp.]
MALTTVKKVRICEVGPRDGLQNEKTLLTTEQKIRLIDGLTDAGFPVIEVGSFVSPKAVPQMANTDDVFRGIKKKDGVEYRALIANLKGVERAIACGCKKVKLNVSASVAHNLANLNCTPAESVARFAACVEKAKENGLGISGSISMAFGSPWDKEIPVDVVCKIIEAYLAVGITEISLSDASGMGYPSQVSQLCQTVKEKYPECTWWLHFHNTRGLGIANVLAGLNAGFTQFDSSFAGVGGCPFVPGAAGNVATEDLLHMLDEMGIETGIDLDQTMVLSREVTRMVGHQTDSYLLRAGKASDLILDIPQKQAKNHTLSK